MGWLRGSITTKSTDDVYSHRLVSLREVTVLQARSYCLVRGEAGEESSREILQKRGEEQHVGGRRSRPPYGGTESMA